MYMILRVIRGIFGFGFAVQMAAIGNGLLALIELSKLHTMDGTGAIFAFMIIKIIPLVIFGYLFFGLRTFTNWLHTKNRGVPHPSLVEKWSL